jgi:hypothetical protein
VISGYFAAARSPALLELVATLVAGTTRVRLLRTRASPQSAARSVTHS